MITLWRILPWLFGAILSAGVQAGSWPQDYERDISKWQEVVPDKNPVRGWPVSGGNVPFPDLHWQVYAENNTVVAEADPSLTRERDPLPPFSPKWKEADWKDTWIALPVADGWLVAFDVGEFGADVVWYNKDGTQQYEIAQEYVDQFLVTPDGIFAQGGLAHMGFAEGHLYRFDRNQEKWQLTRLADTPPHVPIGWLGDRTLLMVTDKVYSCTGAAGLKAFPNNVLPASIKVRIEEARLTPRGGYLFTRNKLYVSSGQWVTEVDLHTLKSRYLIPDSRFLNDRLRWDLSSSAALD